MKCSLMRYLRLMTFGSVALLPIISCSSQEQGGDEIDATEDGGQGEEEVNVSETGEEGTEEGVAAVEGTEEAVPTEDTAAVEGQQGDTTQAGSNTASSDGELKEIISEVGNTAAPAPEALNQTAPLPASNQAPIATTGPVAATPASPAALPEMGSKMSYIVEVGDTLGKIAKKVFGEQNRWREISKFSGLTNPSKIFPGDLVYYKLDQGSLAFAQAYESRHRSTEIVQSGDTLAKLTKRVYGSSKSWKSVWRQNDNIDDPDHLTPGMKVYYIDRGAMQVMNKPKTQTAKQIITLKSKTVSKTKMIVQNEKTKQTHDKIKTQSSKLASSKTSSSNSGISILLAKQLTKLATTLYII